jgi:hypothetical protein
MTVPMFPPMNGLMDIVWIALALAIIGMIIWAFQTYVTIPGPLSWAKGWLTFALVLGACWFIWVNLLANHFHHLSR